MSLRKLLLVCVALATTLAPPTAASAAGPLLGPAPPTILNFFDDGSAEPMIVDANRNGVTDAGDYELIVQPLTYVSGTLSAAEVGQAVAVVKLTYVSDSLINVRARISTLAGSIGILASFDPQSDTGFTGSAQGRIGSEYMSGDTVVTFVGDGADFETTMN